MIADEEFEIFYWGGQKRYKCNQLWESGAPCEYDTYDLTEIKKHAREPHTRRIDDSRPKFNRVVSPVLDAEGCQIIREVPEEFEDFKFKDE